MSRRRDPVAELEQLLRLAEPGEENIAQHLAEHGDAIVPVLGLVRSEIAGLSDEVLAPILDPLLRQHWRRCRAQRCQMTERRALEAAAQVARTSHWTGASFVLDVEVVLGALLADGRRRFIGFVLPSGSVMAVRRSTLVAVARCIPGLPGLSVSVDAEGLRFRWRQGRGGLYFLSQVVGDQPNEQVLHVLLPDPEVAQADELHARRVEVPRRPPRPGGWIGEILATFGWP